MLSRDQIEELTSINCIQGSLICQYLKDGTLFGGDYDGRLGPLTLFINNLDIIKDASILDLGSNAGHFPIEYIRAGAKSVTAIEGRSEFKSQFLKIKDQIFGIDPNKIDWLDCDVKDYIPDKEHDIVSCLGLAYHVENFWPILVGLVSSSKYIIFESSLGVPVHDSITSETIQYIKEMPKDRTATLYPSSVLIMTGAAIEIYLTHYFQKYDMKRIWIIFHYDAEISNFPGHKRGLWLLTKKD